MTEFYSCHETDKKILRVYMVLGDDISTLETFVWILNLVSRSIALTWLQSVNLLSNGSWMTEFYSCHKTDKKFLRVYMVLGDDILTLETFVWILNLVSRSITLTWLQSVNRLVTI